MVVGLLTIGGAGFWLSRQQATSLVENIGWILWGLIGALIIYIYFALELPGTTVFNGIGGWAGLLTTLAGGLLGLIFYLLNRRSTQK